MKEEKACFFGFKCVVVGYEWKLRPEEVSLYVLKLNVLSLDMNRSLDQKRFVYKRSYEFYPSINRNLFQKAF